MHRLPHAEAAAADLASARLSLAGQTAKAWFAAQEARLQLQLAQETLDSRRLTRERIRRRYELGTRGALDLRLSITNEAAAEATPGATVHVAADGIGWVWAVNVLRGHAGLDLRWDRADRARWVLVVGEPALPDRRDKAEHADGLGRAVTEATSRHGLAMALWGPTL